MHSPHLVGLILIGFLTGNAINLMHRDERHPNDFHQFDISICLKSWTDQWDEYAFH